MELNSDWLCEKTLKQLVHDIHKFAHHHHLSERQEAYIWCHAEKKVPAIFLVIGFILLTLMVVFLVFQVDMIIPLAGALGGSLFGAVVTYFMCIRDSLNRTRPDPERPCNRFAANWSARHGLPLTFTRCHGHPSFFQLSRPELERPEPELPNLRDEPKTVAASRANKDEDDGGWAAVKTPTARDTGRSMLEV